MRRLGFIIMIHLGAFLGERTPVVLAYLFFSSPRFISSNQTVNDRISVRAGNST